MRTILNVKNVIRPICLITAMAINVGACADIVNEDFGNGLNDWSADYSYFDGVNEYYYEPVTDFEDFTDNFSTNGNSVTLTTSSDGTNEVFGLYMYQGFEVAANSHELSLTFNVLADHAYVTLVDENLDLLHDFINDGLSVDISNLVGSLVSLEFGIEDEDFVYDDFLTVSNISISKNATSVPEPSSLAIFALAFVALRTRLKTHY